MPNDLPNAPKRYPCEKCHRSCKRTGKTINLATYYCGGCHHNTVINLHRLIYGVKRV